MSSWLEALRRGKEELVEALVEGWEKLQRRSAEGLTRFTRKPDAVKVEGMPDSEESFGLLSAEVFDSDQEVVVRLEAPGMEKDDFELTIERGCLFVKGEKHFERESKEGHYHLFESAYGSFERVIPLPAEVRSGDAQASYRRGVLSVRLPKLVGQTSKRIPVKE